MDTVATKSSGFPVLPDRVLHFLSYINKYLMTDPKKNSEFCFPETLKVPRGPDRVEN